MMSAVKTPTFSSTINRTIGRIVEGNIDQAFRMGQRLQRGLRRLNELFYRTLAQSIVNVSGPPGLGAYSPPEWKPLAASTTKRKGHANFFYDSGALADWLGKASAADLLGPSKVTVSTAEGRVGDVDGFQRTIIRRSTRGKVWVQTLTFSNFKTTGVRGFIKTSELQRYLQPSLTVEVFSNAPSVFSNSGDVSRFLTGNTSAIGYRLMNVAGREDRPIVSQFLEWWIETKAKRLVDRFGRIK